jgi:hypothetical protein
MDPIYSHAFRLVLSFASQCLSAPFIRFAIVIPLMPYYKFTVFLYVYYSKFGLTAISNLTNIRLEQVLLSDYLPKH